MLLAAQNDRTDAIQALIRGGAGRMKNNSEETALIKHQAKAYEYGSDT
jgi:hypothetical protein